MKNFFTKGKKIDSNRKAIRTPFGFKRHKFLVRVFEWVKDASTGEYGLSITESDYPNVKKAQSFVNSLGECDCHIKIYDENDQVIYSEKRGLAKEKDPELYA